jgi:hypothetical protein
MTDWRRALGIYVSGRSRALTLEEKRRLVGGAAPDQEGPEPTMRRNGATRSLEAVYGVTVPRVLDFYRNASTWRTGLPEPKPRAGRASDA